MRLALPNLLGPLAPLALGALALSVLPFVSEALADVKEAETCIRTKIWDGYAAGWAVRTATRATLTEGDYRVYALTLFANTEYRFQACGDRSAGDLDLVLHDAAGNEVLRDQGDGPEPEMSFKPTSTDTYYVAVYLAQAKEPAARVGVSMAATYR